MAEYFVRKSGSDASAGTSAGAAWLTIGKALGATGIASGDTVWIGAGVYREAVSVAMTSATAETKVIGDVFGVKTGDAGEVQWTGYTTNDTSTPSGTTILNINARDFLTFENINFIGGNAVIVTATTSVSTDIHFTRCGFTAGHQGASGLITHTTAANTTANWVIDSCIFIKGAGAAMTFTLTRPATADFDYNIQIKNCLFLGANSNSITISAAGANAFKGGGVDIYNCTHISGGLFVTVANANDSTTIPCTMYNCFGLSGTQIITANLAGQLTEDYNVLIGGSTPRSNVTAGTHSVSDGTYSPLFYIGTELLQQGISRPLGMPKIGSPLLGYGNQASSPAVDILNNPRPSGTVVIFDYGTATSGAATTLTNTNRAWGTNVWAGYTVLIVSGTGSADTKTIASNTATVLTVDGNWKTNPDNTSIYRIYQRETASTGTATAGSTTTLTDANAAWGVNSWAGFTLSVDSGTGSGQTAVITSNTATVLTFSAIVTGLDNTSTYSLYRATSTITVNAGIGSYEGYVPKTFALKRNNRRKLLNSFDNQ